MREIKFRAWGPNIKHMWPWEVLKHIPVDSLDCGEKIIMQYTGLKDSNGKEIYDRDIVKNIINRDGSNLYEIFYCDDAAAFCMEDNSGELGLKDIQEWGCVVGNIYENPELLKE